MSELGEMIRLGPQITAGIAPPRLRGSVRRTSTIDVSWPGSGWGDMLFVARARDLLTPADGSAAKVCAEDSFVATVDPMRTILEMAISPLREAQEKLVGLRGGGHLRAALAEAMPNELAGGTPLSLILDDISGTSLVAGWAWSLWNDGGWGREADGAFDEEQFTRAMAARIDICTGLARGGLAHRLGAKRKPSPGAPTPDLRRPADPQGWHDYAVQSGVAMRRARRIDVTRSADAVLVDAMFQDSATFPDGTRGALHEYTLTLAADPATLRIRAIDADPRVLPFPECPGATASLSLLVGERLSDLRTLVLERLRGTAGCTHLNDAVRSLAEVPLLLKWLAP
jgi:hypothetical protein